MKLKPYQKDVINYIISNPFCAIFLEMGLGKTICVLSAIARLGIKKVLIIAPKMVVETVWVQEAKKWRHTSHLKVVAVIGTHTQRMELIHEPADVYVVSRDVVSWLKVKLPKGYFNMLVVDESTSFKNPTSQRFLALKKIIPLIPRRVILSATPSPNGYHDLWSQYYILDLGLRLEKSISAFRKKYLYPVVKKDYIVYKWGVKEESKGRINYKILDITKVMKADDWIKMPDLILNEIPISIDLKKYNELKKEKVLQLGGVVAPENMAGVVQKLVQIASGAIIHDKGVDYLHEEKLRAMEYIIEHNVGVRYLIAVNFVHDKERVYDFLTEKYPQKVVRKFATSQDVNDWNERKIHFLIANPQSVGHGVNLQQGGHTIIWYNLTWSLELYQQFIGRLYRQGQDQKVFVHHLVATGCGNVLTAYNADDYDDETVDSIIMNTIKSKNGEQEELKEKLLNHINESTTTITR